MNKFHRTLLSLLIAAGLGLGSLPGSEMAQAAEPKRKENRPQNRRPQGEQGQCG